MRFEFDGGRQGEVRCAADIPVGIAGGRGKLAAVVLEADTPALLCEGALKALGGHSDFRRNISTLRKQEVDIPLELSGEEPPLVRPLLS